MQPSVLSSIHRPVCVLRAARPSRHSSRHQTVFGFLSYCHSPTSFLAVFLFFFPSLSPVSRFSLSRLRNYKNEQPVFLLGFLFFGPGFVYIDATPLFISLSGKFCLKGCFLLSTTIFSGYGGLLDLFLISISRSLLCTTSTSANTPKIHSLRSFDENLIFLLVLLLQHAVLCFCNDAGLEPSGYAARECRTSQLGCQSSQR